MHKIKTTQQVKTVQKKTSLFSQTVIDAQKDKQYGSAVLLPAQNIIVITALLLICISAAIYFAANYKFSNTVEVRGWIDADKPGIAIKSADNIGIIKDVFVNNGDLINKGQALFTIKRPLSIISSAKNLHLKTESLKQAQQLKLEKIGGQQNLIRAKRQHIAMQQSLVTKKYLLLSEQSTIFSNQIERLNSQLSKTQRLAQQGIIAESQVDIVRSKLVETQSQVSRLKIQLVETETTKANFAQMALEAQTEIAELEQQIGLLKHSLQSNLLAIEQDLTYTVTAPTDGFIANITLGVGDSVTSSQILANIAANTRVIKAYIYIPSQKANFININKTVNIKVDGFDYKRYGMVAGEIKHIARQITMPQQGQLLPVTPTQPSFLSQLTLDTSYLTYNNTQWSLKPGMLYTASIKLDELTVLEWLLSTLFNAAGQGE